MVHHRYEHHCCKKQQEHVTKNNAEDKIEGYRMHRRWDRGIQNAYINYHAPFLIFLNININSQGRHIQWGKYFIMKSKHHITKETREKKKKNEHDHLPRTHKRTLASFTLELYFFYLEESISTNWLHNWFKKVSFFLLRINGTTQFVNDNTTGDKKKPI